MSSEMIYRAATPSDAFSLAELSIMAGDGMYEFLLAEFVPQEMLAGLIARTMKQEDGGCNWRHCLVAGQPGNVMGMINAFPAAWLRAVERDLLPPDRVQVLDPIDQVQDWEGFLINAVAVRAPHRRQGIGRQLVQWAIGQARLGGFARISVNVWQDNAAAAALFRAEAFQAQAQVPIPAHPALRHTGGSVLLVRPVDSD